MITIRDNHYTLEDTEYIFNILSEKSDRDTCDYTALYTCDNCPRKKVCIDMRYTLKHLAKSYANKLHKATLWTFCKHFQKSLKKVLKCYIIIVSDKHTRAYR